MNAVATIAAMRPFMRFIAALIGLVALYVVYAAMSALTGRSALSPAVGAVMLALAAMSLVPAYLVWQQVEAATRYLNEPTLGRLGDVTATMRRFWQVSGIVAVLQLTVLLVGFALHGGL